MFLNQENIENQELHDHCHISETPETEHWGYQRSARILKWWLWWPWWWQLELMSGDIVTGSIGDVKGPARSSKLPDPTRRHLAPWGHHSPLTSSWNVKGRPKFYLGNKKKFRRERSWSLPIWVSSIIMQHHFIQYTRKLSIIVTNTFEYYRLYRL